MIVTQTSARYQEKSGKVELHKKSSSKKIAGDPDQQAVAKYLSYTKGMIKIYLLMTDSGMLPFTIKKEYIGNPIYFLLQDPKENIIILCRELAEKEKDFKNIVYVINTDENGHEGKPCLVLFEVDSIEKADKIIDSYRRGIKQLENIIKKG